MKKNRKIISSFLAAVLITGAAGCGSEGRGATDTNAVGTAAVTTTDDPDKQFDITSDLNEIADKVEEVASENETGAGELYEAGKKAGEIRVLCYYDFNDISPENKIIDIFAERFGGTVVQENICTSVEYVEKLGVLVASGQSPDIVRYEADMLPSLMINNRLEPLDGWLDIESPLWEDMRDAIDYYSLAGKHYYFPQERQTGYGFTYNTANIEEMGAADPMELYLNDEWTWDALENILEMWQAHKEGAIGISSGSGAPIDFAATTGSVPIQYTGTDIKNNLRDANIMRAMEFCEKLYKNGHIYENYLGPDSSSGWVDRNVLFFNMGCEWTVECGQQTLFKNNVEGTAKFVPMPRDPQADKYYQLGSTYGYLVPVGAQNIQGAASWILAGRIYRTDPELIQEKRDLLMYDGAYYYIKCINKECGHVYDSEKGEENEVCPECGTARKPKFKLTYDEDQMRVSDDLLQNNDKFTFVFSEERGFGSDMLHLFEEGAQETLFDTPYRHGGSYVQLVEAHYNTVESYLAPYRETITEALANAE